MINKLLQDPLKAIFAAFLCIALSWSAWASNKITDLEIKNATLEQKLSGKTDLILEKLDSLEMKFDLIINHKLR